jgi:N-ethylmaleimide reductase
MKAQPLLQPYDMKGLSLQNRIVMAPMTRSRSDNPEGAATELTARYYEQRADAGLIITEGTYVSAEAAGYINVPGIYTDAQVKGWRLVTDAVHARGGKIFAQIWHVGRLSHPDLLGGKLPLAPSALNPNIQAYTFEGFKDTVTPQEMSIADIKRTIDDFRKAGANAMRAGFDGVEIHSANGYLFHQFFNLYSNHRTDDYGGPLENRARLLFEVIEALATVMPLNRVGLRLNPSLHNVQGMVLDEGSIPVHEYIVKRLNDYDLAYLHLTEPFTPVDDIPFAVVQVAKHFRPLYKGTLIINKGFTGESGNSVIAGGDADLVAFGVSFLANPDLVERIRRQVPLNAPDMSTFYTPGPKGYVDYPVLEVVGSPAVG